MGTAALPVGPVYGDCSSPQQRLDVSAKSRGHNAGLLWVHIDALPLTPALLTRIARAAPVLLLSGGFTCSRSARSRLIQGVRRSVWCCRLQQLPLLPAGRRAQHPGWIRDEGTTQQGNQTTLPRAVFCRRAARPNHPAQPRSRAEAPRAHFPSPLGARREGTAVLAVP